MQPVLDLYGTHPFWVWAGVAAALLALEVASGSGWLLWPAASAGFVGVIALVLPQIPAPLAILLFAGVTIVSTLAGRRLTPRFLQSHGHDINDPHARLIGREGKAVSAFSGREGRVFVDGKEWPAALEAGDTLAAGAPVQVTAVSGARLTVRPAPRPPGTP
ncbi:NfeD family protein [Phenylobacterium sp.]|uniref:NfeD family protein n=1 Tax=Phenylobacterium sp. TaxID=1871053 RepID=UPI002F40ED8C